MPDPSDSPQSPDSVSLRIEAPPERIYAIVTDIAQMGRLSPECTGGRWMRGSSGPAVGAKFRGHNKRGIVRWSTTNTVVAADPGRVFSFQTRESSTQWTYRLEADGGGTSVTEERAAFKPRTVVGKAFTKLLLGGVAPHDDELRAGMRSTLERLKAVAEAEAEAG